MAGILGSLRTARIRMEPPMTRFKTRLAAIMLLLWATATPSMAESAASSASSASSASIGSVSDSFSRSSDSSPRTKNVAEGDYKVIEVTEVAQRPGTARMKLQALAERGEDREFDLYLPQQVVEQNQLAQGRIVTAQRRPYGVEFAHAENRQAFFLVLDDDWYRELHTQAVVL